MDTDRSSDDLIDEDARRRFESAWRCGQPKLIAEFLPPATDPRYRATLEELVQIEIEFAWKAANATQVLPASRPRLIEEYLATFPVLNEPNALQRLARQEFEVRRRFGDCPASAEYERRFPDLKGFWDETKRVDAAPSTTDPRPEGYEVLRTVGRGGMGVVFEARQPGLDRIVALKMIRGDAAGVSAEDHERFLAEARIAARLEHPGVVPVHDMVAEAGTSPFYTMKLVRGRTLDDSIGRFHEGTWTDTEAALERQRLLNAFLTVTKTMAFAHSRGVIHRDLKPANIVVGDYGETVILDWGLAKILRESNETSAPSRNGPTDGSSNLTIHGSVMGTPAYMAPEQAAGRIDELDERTDIFALGAVLYRILTGKLPFTGASAQEVVQHVLKSDPVSPRSHDSTIPRPLEAICLKALAKQPAHRYATAAALAADLESHFAGEPVSVYAERLSERMGRWSRRHRTVVTSGVVAFALLLIGGVGGLFYRQKTVNDREKQTAEFERTRNEQRLKHRQSIELAAGELAVLATAEMRASRFDAAERVLHKAVSGMRAEAELADQIARLEARRERARKLAEFYRLWQRAELLAASSNEVAYSKADSDTLDACAGAMKQLGVVAGDEQWWLRLPAEDLDPDQRAQLEVDITVAMGLMAVWRAKVGFLKWSDGGAESIRAARSLLAQIQAYSIHRYGARSHAADSFDVVFGSKLGEPLPPQLRLEPTTAADAYFLGTTHYFLSEPLVQAVIVPMVPIAARKRSGLDFVKPLATAERMLRTAVALEPKHYWAHFWLSRCLTSAGDLAGAEQALNTCVGLRPDYFIGYSVRGLTQLIVINKLEEEKSRKWHGVIADDPVLAALALTREQFPRWNYETGVRLARWDEANRRQIEVKRRALRGMIHAATREPNDPGVLFSLAMCLQRVGRNDEMRLAYTAAAEAFAAQRLFDPQWNSGEQDIVRFMRQDLVAYAARFPNDVDMQAALALIHLALGADDSAATAAAKCPPAHRVAQAVRAGVAFRAKQFGKAADEFAAALDAATTPIAPPNAIMDSAERLPFLHPPGSAIAALGRARSLELLKQPAAALSAYDRLLVGERARSVAAWQRLQIHLGRARVLMRLNRPDEAHGAIDDARQLDSNLADDLAGQLFPAVDR